MCWIDCCPCLLVDVVGLLLSTIANVKPAMNVKLVHARTAMTNIKPVNPCTIFIEFHYEQPLLLLTMTVISNIKAAMIVAATAGLFLRTSLH